MIKEPAKSYADITTDERNSFMQRLLFEACFDPVNKELNASFLTGTARPTLATVGTSIGGIFATQTPGKLFLCYGYDVFVDRPTSAYIRLQLGKFTTTAYQEGTDMLKIIPMGSNNANWSFSCSFTKPILIYEGGGLRLAAQSLVAGRESPFIGMSMRGVSITNDLDFDAKHTFGTIGNSLLWRAMGEKTVVNSNGTFTTTTSELEMGKSLIGFRMADYAKTNGKSVRHLNRDFGGSTVTDWVNAIDGGFMDNIPLSVCLASFGTNEAAAGGSAAQLLAYYNDLKYICEQLIKRNPSMLLILMGAPITDASNRPTQVMADYRTQTQNVVSSFNSANVVYFDSTAGWSLNATPANDYLFSSYERTTGTTTSRLHPSGPGHEKHFNNLLTQHGAKILAALS